MLRQCKGIHIILHSALAAPRPWISVVDQLVAALEPPASARITAPPPDTPTGSDATLIGLWLAGRPATTRRAYAADCRALQACLGGPLCRATLGDLQAFAASLARLAPASQARRLAAAKTLFSFGHRLGILAFDTARPLRLPKVKTVLAETSWRRPRC